jgi:2-polyprenyl-3-methyl-5-hydroxy-6-metoxy-1,4-benzoquinol methylase
MSNERDIWDFWAPRYEGLWAQKYSLGPSRRLIHEHLDAVAPDAQRILDVGCGVGQLAQELALRRPGCEVVGCDASPDMIARATADYTAPNLRHHHGPVERMERGSGFDAVVCTHAFPYFPDKPASMAAMAALLRPAGRLLIIQANTEDLYDRLWLLVVRLTTTPSRYHGAAGLHGLMQGAGLTPGIVRSVDKPRWIPSIQLVEGIR